MTDMNSLFGLEYYLFYQNESNIESQAIYKYKRDGLDIILGHNFNYFYTISISRYNFYNVCFSKTNGYQYKMCCVRSVLCLICQQL